jgi:hypothetical protein
MPTRTDDSRRLRFAIRILASTVFIASMFIASCFFHVSDAAVNWLRGEDLAASPAVVDLGEFAPDDSKQIAVHILNMSPAAVTLTGIHTSCSCVTADQLPAVVESHHEYLLNLVIHSSREAGRFVREAVVYSNSKVTPRLLIRLSGRACEKWASAGNAATNAVARE